MPLAKCSPIKKCCSASTGIKNTYSHDRQNMSLCLTTHVNPRTRDNF